MELSEIIKDFDEISIEKRRRVWKNFMQKYNIQSVCEVGVRASENFMRLLGGNPKIAVGVDIWAEDGDKNHNDALYSQERLDAECDFFKSLMKDNPSVRLYRQYSDEAAKNFPDEYFDLIYIDGDHSYEGCKKDLEAWWPKVKPGRFFTGDDYSYSRAHRSMPRFGVIPAVNEFAQKVNREVHEGPQHGWIIIK